MKKIIFFICVSFLGFNLAYSKDIKSSQIDKVILFTNQALVTRTANIKVNEGLNELSLEVEAFNVDADSVQAKVYGEGEIYSIQFKEIPLKEHPQKNIEELESKIQKLKDEKRSLQNSLDVLRKESSFLSSLINFSNVQIPKDMKTVFPDAGELKETLAFLRESYTTINNNQEEIELKIRDIGQEALLLQRQLNSLRVPAGKSKKAIEILFNSQSQQEVKIEATYLAYNAYWKPFYKVNVSLNLEDISLTMFSKLRQMTGEDWKNIKLSISNVVPLQGAGLPSLDSWVLDISRPMPAREAERLDYGFGVGASKSLMAQSDMEKGKVEEAKVVYAQKVELPFSFEYELPQALDIESKDKEATLPLFSKQAEGKFYHYAVPKYNALTYLVSEITPDTELLAGPLNIYFANRFVGKTYLSAKKAGDPFEINLGADRAVVTKHQKVKDQIDETFFNKIQRQTVVRNLSFKITAENLKNEKVKLKILDNLPVSRTDKIEIKNVKISPSPSEENYQDNEGVNMWIFSLSPKAKQEITIEYTLTYPKDTYIPGL